MKKVTIYLKSGQEMVVMMTRAQVKTLREKFHDTKQDWKHHQVEQDGRNGYGFSTANISAYKVEYVSKED